MTTISRDTRAALCVPLLAFIAPLAEAQSSVTLYGTVDLNARYVKNDGSGRRLSLSQDGINASQLGFRGIEDLGGGLKAGFILLSGVNADSGTTPARFFNRRSTVSLFGNWGEIRLGRDYVPSLWNTVLFDPFGQFGSGSSVNVGRLYSSTVSQLTGPGAVTPLVSTYARADNSIGYFLPPNLGGAYGQLMVAAAEGDTLATSTNGGRYLGGRLGFAAGGLDVAASYGLTSSAGNTNGKRRPEMTIWNVAGSYDFRVIKIMAQYNDDKTEIPVVEVHERRYVGGIVVPLGVGELKASYTYSDAANGPDADQMAVGYVYHLSKRTAVYASASMVRNRGDSITGGRFSVVGSNASAATAQAAPPTRGGNSRGGEFGLRHFF